MTITDEFTVTTAQVGAVDLRTDDGTARLSARRCSDGNGTLSALFFSEELCDIRRAKAICAKCTSHTECLAGALEREEPWGVWGGHLVENGRIQHNKRARGRPPKHTACAEQVEEVPVPAHLVA